MARKPKSTKRRKPIPSDILTHLWDADFDELRRQRPKTQTVDGVTYWFDQEAADRAVAFIETFCRHVEGSCRGQLFLLDPWQRWMVEEIFGWKRPDGTRRYRKVFLLVARKNGKTTLMAALLLYLTILDGEKGARVYAVAAEKEQARQLFKTSQKMIEQDETLSKLCQVFRDSITFASGTDEAAAYVRSAEAYSTHGLNPSAVLIDELHAHQNRELFDVLATSFGARKQPLLISITTAGIFDKEHICYLEYDEAKATAADPRVNPSLLPVLFEMDPKDELTVENLAKANPSLASGNAIQIDFLEQQIRKAQREPSFFNTVLRLHGNVWTSQADRWLDMPRWHELERMAPPFPLEGRDVVIGVDLSKTTDLSAVAEIYPFQLQEVFGPSAEAGDSHWGVWLQATCWTPSERLIERSAADHAEYEAWARRGHIRLIDGPVIDDTVIEDHIREIAKSRKLRMSVFDPWGMTGVGARLEKDGFPIEALKPGWKMSEAAKTFEGLLIAGTLLHQTNPCVDYCARNVAVDTDKHGNVYPVKGKSRGRIDAIFAAILAMDRVMREPFHKARKSVYSERGVILL